MNALWRYIKTCGGGESISFAGTENNTKWPTVCPSSHIQMALINECHSSRTIFTYKGVWPHGKLLLSFFFRTNRVFQCMPYGKLKKKSGAFLRKPRAFLVPTRNNWRNHDLLGIKARKSLQCGQPLRDLSLHHLNRSRHNLLLLEAFCIVTY